MPSPPLQRDVELITIEAERCLARLEKLQELVVRCMAWHDRTIASLLAEEIRASSRQTRIRRQVPR